MVIDNKDIFIARYLRLVQLAQEFKRLLDLPEDELKVISDIFNQLPVGDSKDGIE